jgi:hypothetical protein
MTLMTTAMDWGESFVTLKLSTLPEPEGVMEADMGTKEKAPTDAAAPIMMSANISRRLAFILPPFSMSASNDHFMNHGAQSYY